MWRWCSTAANNSRASTRLLYFCPSRAASSRCPPVPRRFSSHSAKLLTWPVCTELCSYDSSYKQVDLQFQSYQLTAGPASAFRGRFRQTGLSHPHAPARPRPIRFRSQTPAASSYTRRRQPCCLLAFRSESPPPDHSTAGPPAGSPSCLRPPPLVELLRAGSRHLRCQCHSSLVERRAGQLPPWRHQPRQPAFIARSGPHALPPSDASEHPAITLPSTNADLHPPRRI